MIVSRYSVRQSASLAGVTRGSTARVCFIPAHRAPGVKQHFDERREMCRGAGAVDEQGLGRAANARAPELGVENDRFGFAEIGVAIDEHMHDPFEMREDRHPCLGLDAGDEALAAARHDHIEIAVEPAEHFADRRAVPYRHEADRGVRANPRLQEPATRQSWIAARGKKAFRTGAQDGRIAGLETQRAGIRRHRRAAFINDTNNAERGCDALDQESIRPLESRQHAADGIGQGGDGVEALGHGLDAGVIEREAIEKGAGRALRLGGRHVARIGGENICRSFTDAVGGVADRKVFRLCRSQRKRMRGGAGGAADPGHDRRWYRPPMAVFDRFKMSHWHPVPRRQSCRAQGPYRPGG